MFTLSISDWAERADAAQRAYLAQSVALAELLAADELVGWDNLHDLRAVHAELAEEWPTVTWPALCGPRGADVSRFVPSLNELRMAPQDLHCLAYSHELAHVLAPTVGHGEVWAKQQLALLNLMAVRLSSAEIAAARLRLDNHYALVGVID